MKRDRTEWKIDNDVIYDWQQQLWFYKGRKYVICTFNLPKSNQFNWRPAVKWYVALQWTFSVNNIIGNSSNAKNNLPKQVWVSDVQCRYMPRPDIWCDRCAQSGDPDGPTSEERPWCRPTNLVVEGNCLIKFLSVGLFYQPIKIKECTNAPNKRGA